jgi:hypothetical protein
MQKKIFVVWFSMVFIFVQFSLSQIIPTSRQGTWSQAGFSETQKVIPRNFSAAANVLLHNLKNDGATDNTTALQTLIQFYAAKINADSISSVVLYFPSGTYIFRSAIEINAAQINGAHNIVLRGAGSDQTTCHFICSTSSSFDPLLNIQNTHDVGIENIKVERENTPTNNPDNISFYTCYSCWVYGVESIKPARFHVNISASNNIVVKGCSQYDAEATGEGGQGYGVNIAGSSYHCLIEDNIIRYLRHGVVFQDNAHDNVGGYNYVRDSHAWSGSHYYQEWDILFHGSGNYNNLFEGSVVDLIGADNKNGPSGSYNTFFRNIAYGAISLDETCQIGEYQCNLVANVFTQNNLMFVPTFDDRSGDLIDGYGLSLGYYRTHGYHMLSINNNCGEWNSGTCSCENNFSLDDYSYYYTSNAITPPDFWNSNITWPSIGPRRPNQSFPLSQINPAKYRWDHSSKLTVDAPRPTVPTTLAITAAHFYESGSGGTYAVHSSNVNSSYASVLNFMDTLTITANPPTGYVFDSWSDNVRDNPRFVTMTQDTTIYANYKAHLASNVGGVTNGNGQQRIGSSYYQASSNLYAGEDIVVYCSAGEIWATSYDWLSETWSPEVRLSDGSGQNSEPSLAVRGINQSYDLYSYSLQHDGIYAVWQKQTGTNTWDVCFALRIDNQWRIADYYGRPYIVNKFNPGNSSSDSCTVAPKPVITTFNIASGSSCIEYVSIVYNKTSTQIARKYAVMVNNFSDGYFNTANMLSTTSSGVLCLSQPAGQIGTNDTITLLYSKYDYTQASGVLATVDGVAYVWGHTNQWSTPQLVPAADGRSLNTDPHNWYGALYFTLGIWSPQVIRRNGKVEYAWIEMQTFEDPNVPFIVYQDRLSNGTWNSQYYVWDLLNIYDWSQVPSSVSLGNQTINGADVTTLRWSINNTLYAATDSNGVWNTTVSSGTGNDPQMTYFGTTPIGNASSDVNYYLYSQAGSSLWPIKTPLTIDQENLQQSTIAVSALSKKTTGGSLSLNKSIAPSTTVGKRKSAATTGTPVECSYSRTVVITDTAAKAQLSISVSQPKLGKRQLAFNAISDTTSIDASNFLNYLSTQQTTVGDDDDTLSFAVSISSKNLKTNPSALAVNLTGSSASRRNASLASLSHDVSKKWNKQQIAVSTTSLKGKTLGTLLSGFDVSTLGKNLQFSLAHVYKLPAPDTTAVTKQPVTTTTAATLVVTGLQGNYPNPFNPTTTINYQLQVASRVSLKIYDVLGREIVTLVDGMKEPGTYNATFDGSRLASGMYFARFIVNPQSGRQIVQVKKMLMIK